MIVGVIQTSPQFGEKETNRREIETLVGNARADLWVMTELALTGYEFRDRAEVAELAEELPHGESVQWLARFCSERGCHAVMGIAERAGRALYNSCMLAGPQGYIGSYRKLHLFDFEKERFDPGDRPLAVFDLGMARVGLMICFDWRFPEVARSLTLFGAQILAHPSNLVMPYAQAAMVTRALENRVFTLTANRVGTEDRAGRAVTFTGASLIVSPAGEQLEIGAAAKADVLTAEIDPNAADNKLINAHNDLVADRRPEFYVTEYPDAAG